MEFAVHKVPTDIGQRELDIRAIQMLEKIQRSESEIHHSSDASSSKTIGVLHQLESYLQDADVRHRHHLYDPSWSHQRRAVAKVIGSHRFEGVLLGLIVFNMACTIIETNARVREPEEVHWSRVLNNIILFIYLIEISLRAYVQRGLFLLSYVNITDSCILVIDVSSEILAGVLGNVPAIAMLRMIRVIRFLRAGHFVVFFPELYWMIRGMFTAFKTFFWGVILIHVVLTMWSIIAVEVIHPLNIEIAQSGEYEDCERCARAFESVQMSLMTFTQQVVAGDSWGKIALPLMERHPWTAFVFMGAIYSINLGVLNLILAVIVDRAHQAHADDLAQVNNLKAREYEKARQHLSKLLESMDQDGDNVLSYNEILQGFKDNADFGDCLSAMDIGPEDMEVVFTILDKDKDGTVDYNEFVDQLYRMKCSDAHTLLIFIKHYITEVRHNTVEQMRILIDVAKKISQDQSEALTNFAKSMGVNNQAVDGMDQSRATGIGSVSNVEDAVRELTDSFQAANLYLATEENMAPLTASRRTRLSRSGPDPCQCPAAPQPAPSGGGRPSPRSCQGPSLPEDRAIGIASARGRRPSASAEQEAATLGSSSWKVKMVRMVSQGAVWPPSSAS